MAYRTTARMRARKEQRRRNLLDVATRLFGDSGFHRTTVPAVVAASGTSTGSFYMYFANKEALFAAVLRDIGERLASHLDAAIASRSDLQAQMCAAVEGFFLFLAQHPGEGRILLIESSGLGQALEQVRREVLASHVRGVDQALRAGQARGRSADTALLARCWVGAVHEAARYWLELAPRNRRDPRRVAGDVALFNSRGVGYGAPRKGVGRRRRPPHTL